MRKTNIATLDYIDEKQSKAIATTLKLLLVVIMMKFLITPNALSTTPMALSCSASASGDW